MVLKWPLVWLAIIVSANKVVIHDANATIPRRLSQSVPSRPNGNGALLIANSRVSGDLEHRQLQTLLDVENLKLIEFSHGHTRPADDDEAVLIKGKHAMEEAGRGGLGDDFPF